ncbi:MAG: SMC-Scp complex subunit ScpB [Gammaproteobacteria bacterium]|nr:MAG: SMC-Scp complex subunit ScpB [Gammaproteobacteria bacterium]
MDDNEIKYFIESALLAAGRPLSIDQLQHLFADDSQPEKSQLRQAISSLLDDYADRGMTITEVASGFRLQLKLEMADRLQKLWEERPPRYSRALFETLALIAYRQPMTRGEIEEIRGVAVSTNIIRSLLEREWVRVVGHRDVPGRPAMFGTTKMFLDYFNLKKLDDLPPLADLSDWESLRVQLNLPAVEEDEEPEPAIPVPDLPVLYPEDEDGDDAAGEDGAEVAEIEVEAVAAIASEDSTSDEPRAVVEDIPDIEAALSAEGNLEPIEATEWPEPGEDQTVIQAIDEDENEDEEPDSDEEQEDDRQETDSSATNAR